MINRKHAIRCSTWLLIHGNNFKSYVCLMSDQMNKANKIQCRTEEKKMQWKKRGKDFVNYLVIAYLALHLLMNYLFFIIFIRICFAIFPSSWNSIHRFSNGMHFHRTEPYYHIRLQCISYFVFLYAKYKNSSNRILFFFSRRDTQKVRNPWNDYVTQQLWAHTIRKE